MHFDNIQMIKEAVALGSGVSILPARTMQAEIEQGRLVAVPPAKRPAWCARSASCTAGAREGQA
jgi:DNA-binding transcriptional LysR family regulator